MREIENDRAAGRFQARRIIDDRETAVSVGHPLTLREARDPNMVLNILRPLVGKSAAQIGEMKLTRITDKSIEHLMNSEHARFGQRMGKKEGKKLWRGTVAGMSVAKDIIGTSKLGTEQDARHVNAPWKRKSKFYMADTRFAVELENGEYEIYPCKLIVSETNGERQIYDITEIGKPTLTASSTLSNANLVPGVNATTGAPGSAHTGESAYPTRGSIPNVGNGDNLTQPTAKMSVPPVYTGKEAVADPDVFVFDPNAKITMAMGDKEPNAAGVAAGIEKKEALRPWTRKDSPADLAKPIAFDAADMIQFWRAVSGSLRNPHVQKGRCTTCTRPYTK